MRLRRPFDAAFARGDGAFFKADAISSPAGPMAGQPVQALTLRPSGEAYDPTPQPVLVSLAYDTTTALWVGQFEVFATVRWAIGKLAHTMVLDVPAGGTVFTVAASDGLDVEMNALGDSVAALASVTAHACYATASHPRAARRTLRWTLAAESGTVQRAPAWARSVSLLSTVTPFPATTLDFYSCPVAGAGVSLGQVVGASGVSWDIPAGTDAFRVTSAIAHNLFLVCELCP